jgi:hypothetical protein
MLKISQHALTQFRRRFHELALLAHDDRLLARKLVADSPVKVFEKHPNKGNQWRYVNGPLVGIIKKGVIVTIFRDYDYS